MIKWMLFKFFAMNHKLCDKIEPHLPQAQTDLFSLYEKIVAQHMNSRPEQTLVDVGGGRSCAFAKDRDPAKRAKIIAVDVSAEELKHNTDVQEKRVANIAEGLPFGAEEIDLIVSRSVLEHLEKLDEFVADSRRVVKKGGYFIHLLPSKFAPFSILNQALPQALSRKAVHFFIPESKGICGFPAFYKNCYYSGINSLFKRHGFKIINIHLSYYQSPYFKSFAPLFLLSALYEALVQALGAKNLCAYLLVISTKR